MVLEGGRPFAIPDYYARAAAVLYAVSTRIIFAGRGHHSDSDVCPSIFQDSKVAER